jgi:hypothetical protein
LPSLPSKIIKVIHRCSVISMGYVKYKEQQKPQYHENLNLRQNSKAKQKKVKDPFASNAEITIKHIISKLSS